jgi:hypothetical protein
VRFLTVTLLVAGCVVAPVAAAQTAGPTVAARPAVSKSTVHGHSKSAKNHRTPRKVKHTAHKPRTARSTAKSKPAAHRAPVRQTATAGPELALRV